MDPKIDTYSEVIVTHREFDNSVVMLVASHDEAMASQYVLEEILGRLPGEFSVDVRDVVCQRYPY